MRGEEEEQVLAVPPVLWVRVPSVEPLFVVVAVQFKDVRITVGVAVSRTPFLPCHRPLNTLGTVSDP